MKRFLSLSRYKVGCRWLGTTYYAYVNAPCVKDAVDKVIDSYAAFSTMPTHYWVEDSLILDDQEND